MVASVGLYKNGFEKILGGNDIPVEARNGLPRIENVRPKTCSEYPVKLMFPGVHKVSTF